MGTLQLGQVDWQLWGCPPPQAYPGWGQAEVLGAAGLPILGSVSVTLSPVHTKLPTAPGLLLAVGLAPTCQAWETQRS